MIILELREIYIEKLKYLKKYKPNEIKKALLDI